MRRASSLYGGRTAEQRRTERRGRFIGVAHDIWREAGWAAVTMRKVCEKAALNSRYFYADFSDRDDLLVAVWDGVRNELLGRLRDLFLAEAGQLPLQTMREAVAVVVRWIAEDFPRAQILLGIHSGCRALEQRRRDSLREVIEMVTLAAQPYLRASADPAALHVDIVVGVHGFTGLVSEWHVGNIDLTEDEIIAQATRMGATVARQHLALDHLPDMAV
jgi:AcrR family transcriptional regulator